MAAERGNVEAVPATSPAGAVSAGIAARPRWVVPVAIVLVVVLIGALVTVVWFGIKTAHGFGVERSRDHAVEAAKVVATRLTSFDSGTADADTAALIAATTPEYAAALHGDAGGVIKAMHQTQARSAGTVTEAGILSYDDTTHTAHVLVTVRAQVANKAVPAGQARDYRLDLTMVEQGQWLANAVEFVA